MTTVDLISGVKHAHSMGETRAFAFLVVVQFWRIREIPTGAHT